MLSFNEVDGRFGLFIGDDCGFGTRCGGGEKVGETMSSVSHSMSFCAFCK